MQRIMNRINELNHQEPITSTRILSFIHQSQEQHLEKNHVEPPIALITGGTPGIEKAIAIATQKDE